ncbi:MAG: hypothetical protein K2U26_01585 [Cyclobacteriaceae bacterium]|nr:hypothetical protein [Cyclobacteriaceae bacterium]
MKTILLICLICVMGSRFNGYEFNIVGGAPPDGFPSSSGGHIRLGGSARGDASINIIQFLQNGVERMRVQDGGNVGIGTSTPAAKLHAHNSNPLGSVAGNTQLLLQVSGRGDNHFASNHWLRRVSNGFEWWSTALHDGISIDGSFGTPGVDTRTWWERHPSQDIQSWGNANTTHMVLNSGNLGIGTTSRGSYRLAVAGKIAATG